MKKKPDQVIASTYCMRLQKLASDADSAGHSTEFLLAMLMALQYGLNNRHKKIQLAEEMERMVRVLRTIVRDGKVEPMVYHYLFDQLQLAKDGIVRHYEAEQAATA